VISWQALAITAPLAVAVLVASSLTPADSIAWLLIGLVTVVLVGGWAYLMHRTVFRDRALHPVPLRWVVSSALVSGTLYVATAIVLGLALDVVDPALIVLQFVPLFAVTVTFSLLLTLVLDSQWRFRVQREELIAQAVQQQLASAQETEVLQEIRQALASEVGQRVKATNEPLLSRIDELVATGGADASTLASELRAVAEATVRPLSHELEDRARQRHPTPGVFASLGNIARHQPFRPLAVSVIYAITTTPREIVDNGLSIGLGLLFVTVAFIFAIMMGLNSAMRRWPERHARIYLVGLIVVQLPTVILNPLRQELTGQSLSASDLVATMVFGTVIVVATSAYGSWSRTRRQVIADFQREVNGETIGTLARGEAVARATRDAALILHGSVQTQLYAAAMALDEAARSGDLGEVNHALVRARAVLKEPGIERLDVSSETLQELLDSRVTQWNGLLTVSVNLDPRVAAMVGDAAAHVAAVMEEGIANAFHHGSATNVEVVVVDDGAGAVVTVTDDGAGPAGGSPGLGSRLFATGGLPWRLEGVDSGSRLVVRVRSGD